MTTPRTDWTSVLIVAAVLGVVALLVSFGIRLALTPDLNTVTVHKSQDRISPATGIPAWFGNTAGMALQWKPDTPPTP